MMRRLRALDRHDARLIAAGKDPLVEWRRSREGRLSVDTLAMPPARRDWGRATRRYGLVIAVGMTVLLTMVSGWGTRWANHHAAPRLAGFPRAGVDEHAHRLGTPAPAPAGTGGYAFMRTQGGGPVTWDPCRPIHYVTAGIAPAELRGVVASVTAELTRITGFQFVDDGPTDEQASTSRSGRTQVRYGDRWAPVLVAWTDPGRIPRLAGDTIGLGGPDAVSTNGDPATYVSGFVYLDTPQIDQLLASAAATGRTAQVLAAARAIVLHEFGHLVGLAHVTDRNAIMYHQEQPDVTDYAAGDLRGLHALSVGRCAPHL